MMSPTIAKQGPCPRHLAGRQGSRLSAGDNSKLPDRVRPWNQLAPAVVLKERPRSLRVSSSRFLLRSQCVRHGGRGAVRTDLHLPTQPLPALSRAHGLKMEPEGRPTGQFSHTRQAPGSESGELSQTTLPFPDPGCVLTTTPASSEQPVLLGHPREGQGLADTDRLPSCCKDAARTCAHRYTRRTPAAAPAHRRGRTSHLYTCRGPSTPCHLQHCQEGGTHCCYLEARSKHTGHRESHGQQSYRGRPLILTNISTTLHKE